MLICIVITCPFISQQLNVILKQNMKHGKKVNMEKNPKHKKLGILNLFKSIEIYTKIEKKVVIFFNII